MIELHQLAKSFGERPALRDVSFNAPNGRVTALLGPNGAGKTTSLRILTGLLRADRGEARVDGFEVGRRTSEVRRRLGVLGESTGLYPRLTAREHLEYAGALQGLSGRHLSAAVDRALAQLGMQELAARRTEGFSQGETRKVLLARALVHDPPNILLDEPTNGLDVASARAVRQAIRTLAEAGKCVILSSHILHEVSAVSDRVVVLAAGRVVAEGSSEDLLRRTGASDLETAFLQLIGTEEGVQ